MIFKLLSTIKSVSEDNGVLRIKGYASTSDTDRAGDVVLPSAWSSTGLDNFKLNPIILFNHNYNKPIGRAVELEIDAKGLLITCEISSAAGEIKALIKDGVLTTFSVGFMIKQADYNETTDGYIIKEAELYEVSVVSVPCNQGAVFSISKSLKPDELKVFKKDILGQVSEEENSDAVKTPIIDPKEGSKPEKKMNEEELAAFGAKIAQAALAQQKAASDAEAQLKASKEAEDAKISAASEKAATVAATAAAKSVEESMLGTFDTKLKENNENWEKTFNEMKADFEAKSTELKAMYESKRNFSDRGGSVTDLSKDTEALEMAKDAYVLSKITKQAMLDTVVGKAFAQKYNQHSSVEVGDDNLELTVSTSIERDIWNALVLAPMFREVTMNSATMTFPIMPDAGYAEITTNTTAAGTQPGGNMDERGATFGSPYGGIGLSNQTLTTIKMISKAYLGNETEEDAILPILPLIRESMIRSQKRSVENMFLAGNHADGVYTSGAANGLIKIASTGSRTLTAAGTATKLTGAALLDMRKAMGKYGINPMDVNYIVSQSCYFDLLQDAEFADMDLVGGQAIKITGQVGTIYGSKVVICDEFATPATGKYHALAVNTRNFIVPRLRGVTVESEYQVENQRTALVTSQRLGFNEVIPSATAVIGLKYA